jgi:cytochrome c556
LKRFALFCVLVPALACAAAAEFSKPELAVKYRQSALFLMGMHMQRIKAELDVSKPNLEVLRQNADIVNELKVLPYDAFIPGTADIEDTAAKPEIWTDNERFRKLAREMQDRVADLDAATHAGDVPAIRSAFDAAGKACKNCHEDFRRKR